MRLLHPHVRDLTAEDLLDLYDPGPGPHLRAGFVASVDGTIAVDGTSAGLGSPADKAVFRALRAVADAVVVGAGTARDEDYGPVRYGDSAAAWRATHGRASDCPVVVVSRSGDLPPKLAGGPVLLAVPADVATALTADEDLPHSVTVIPTTEPVALVAWLRERGLTRLLCEGGPGLLTSLLGADVLDELCLTSSPQLLGTGPGLVGEVPAHDLHLASLVHADPGVLLARWTVVRS